jgi:hypothetical protein
MFFPETYRNDPQPDPPGTGGDNEKFFTRKAALLAVTAGSRDRTPPN